MVQTPQQTQRNYKKKWEKRDREEVTVEKEATLGAAEEAVEEEEEAMAEAEEGEATVAEAGVVAEAMIADTIATADRTGTADRHQWKKVKKLTSQ
jgi:hypothetical protein